MRDEVDWTQEKNTNRCHGDGDLLGDVKLIKIKGTIETEPRR